MMTKEEAVELLQACTYFGRSAWEFEEAKEMAIKALTADDKPVVKGEWRNMQGETVPLDEEGRVRGGVLCTVCGDYLEGSGAYRVRGIFCPNCGADMRKEVKDD